MSDLPGFAFNGELIGATIHFKDISLRRMETEALPGIPVTTKYKALIPMVTTTKSGFFKSDFTSVKAAEKPCMQD